MCKENVCVCEMRMYVCVRRMYVCVSAKIYVCEWRMYVCESARMNYGLNGPSYTYIHTYIHTCRVRFVKKTEGGMLLKMFFSLLGYSLT